MSRGRGRRIVGSAALAATLALGLPLAGAAQGGPGFLFKRPLVTLKVEAGYDLRVAGSEVYDFTREQLTVSRHDFFAPFVGGELAARASERWDIALGFGYSKSSKGSEFRDWVDLDNLPIEQVTELRLVPITVTVKHYLNDRGRSVSRFAWVPNRFAPYVGAGIGILSYRFEQEGDFVDFETLDIFFDRFSSSGETLLLRGVAGMMVSLTNQLELSGELRYSYANDDMSNDFEGFDPLDLSGFKGVIGIGVRF